MSIDTEKDEGQGKAGFERALQELEALIGNIEKGNITLEESLRLFEQGITLARRCETELEQAEQRVRTLLEQNQQQTLEDFAPQPEPVPDRE